MIGQHYFKLLLGVNINQIKKSGFIEPYGVIRPQSV